MTLAAFLCFISILCLFGYWLLGIPGVWAAAIELEVERGVTPEKARIRLGWRRIEHLGLAILSAALAVTA